MDALFEFIGTLFGELYVELVMSLVPRNKLKKGVEIFLKALCAVVFVGTFLTLIIGAGMMIEPTNDGDVRNGTIMLAVSLSVIALHIALFIINICVKKRRTKKLKSLIGKPVHVIIDRKLGMSHPEHENMVYEVNYGYVSDVIGGDGEAQDVYVLGVDEPIDEFDGVVVAVIHRLNDNEDKWVAAPRGKKIGVREIRKKTKFTEKYFNSEIIK